MVDRLISAYRAEVYDWSLSDWKTLWKENKRYVLSLFGYIALLIILLLVWYNTKLNIILLFTVLGEGISVFIIDRYTQYGNISAFFQTGRSILRKSYLF